jgi:uncharacterized protein YxeA
MMNSIKEGLAMKKLMILLLGVLLTAIMSFSLTTTASISGDVESVELLDDPNLAP